MALFFAQAGVLKKPTPAFFKIILKGLLLFFFSFFYVPWIPSFFPIFFDVDASWMIALHHFFETKKQFGVEVVFTYGPYGFLMPVRYYPSTYPITLSSYALLFLVFSQAVWTILKTSIPNFWLRLLWISIISLFALPATDNYFFTCFVIGFVVLISKTDKRFDAQQYFIAFAFALIALIKFTYFLVLIPILAILFIKDAVRRQVPWISFFMVLVYLGLWKLAGQNYSNLGAYFRNSFEVASGYMQGLASPATPWPGYPEIFYVLSVVLLIFAVWGGQTKKLAFNSISTVFFLAYIGFVVFKASYVRFDFAHAIVALLFAPAVAFIYMPAIFTSANQKRWKVFAVFTLLFSLAAAFAGFHFHKIKPMEQFDKSLSLLSTKLTLLRSMGPKEIHREIIRLVVQRAPIMKLSGATDVYHYQAGYLVANQSIYKPRPIFQSYAAYTSRLSEINLNHLRREDAPESIFFYIDHPVGGLPAFLDGFSWPHMASRYAPIKSNGAMVLLDKLKTPRRYRLEPLYMKTASWGEDVAVPQLGDRGKVWVQIEVTPSLRNKILNLIFRPVFALLRIESESQSWDFRLNTSLAKGGFLLSPLITDTNAFIDAFYRSDANKGVMVSKIKILTIGNFKPDDFFEKEIKIYFYSLEMSDLMPGSAGEESFPR